MSNNIKLQLASFLNKARQEFSTLKEIQNPEDVKTSVKVIIEQCISILDYAFNSFSYNPKSIESNFPRPENRSHMGYWEMIDKKLEVTKNQNNDQLIAFLKNCTHIIKKNNWNLRFLPGHIKHRDTEDIISKTYKTHYEYEGIGNEPVLTKKGLLVPGISYFPKGVNLHMSNCVSVGPGYCSVIENLKYYPIEISGKYITFHDNDVIVRKNLELWLKSCIKTCEEIINII